MTSNEITYEFIKTMQLSHLLASDVGLAGLEATIIDTIFNSKISITDHNIVDEIKKLFKIEINDGKVKQTILKLVSLNKLYYIGENIYICPDVTGEVSRMVKENQDLEEESLNEWVSKFKEEFSLVLSEKDSQTIRESILKYVRCFFLYHGADSFVLISESKIDKNEVFDIRNLIKESSEEIPDKYKKDFQVLLHNLFNYNMTIVQKQFCIKQINKAVSYLSTVADVEVKQTILNQVKGLTIYLDTPILYRLLNLQGESRYNTIKNLITCLNNNDINLKVLQTTYDELKRCIAYDARVIEENPVPVDFAAIGYKCRTSDNYISTFWKMRKDNGISPKDFNFMYNDLKSLIQDNKIEIDTVDYITEMDLSYSQKILEEKVAQFSYSDLEYRKSDSSIEHDACCLAIIEYIRDNNASSAINSKFVFLSSDWSLIRLQRYDTEYKDKVDLVLLPSQFMQLFNIIQPTESFYESFLGLFSSSSTSFGSSPLSNSNIQQILGRVASYKGTNVAFAERVLSNYLIIKTFESKEKEEEQLKLIDDVMLQEVENLEDELNYHRDRTKTVENENLEKSSKIEDISKRLVALEESKKENEIIDKIKEDKIEGLTKYKNHFNEIILKRSKQKAYAVLLVGSLLITAGIVCLLIGIFCFIPPLSPIAEPCISWMKSSIIMKDIEAASETLIGSLITIGLSLVSSGIVIIKPGYKDLQQKYYDKELKKL
jgi:hypothetical protein